MRYSFRYFVILTAAVALALPGRPARAQSGVFSLGNIVSATPGGSGSFDILLTALGGDLSVGSFTAQPFLSGDGVTFTAAGFTTAAPYIFPDSFDQTNGFTLSDETDDPFPNTDFIASDSDTTANSAVTIADGTTVGLAHVTFQFDARDAPGSTYPVNFDGDGTSLSDGLGNALPFTTVPGALTASPAAAPEPSGVAAFACAALCIAGRLLQARRRRTA